MMPIVPTPAAARYEGGRRAEPAGAEEEHLGVEQLELALLGDLGEQQVAVVAVALLGGERLRDPPRTALVLPAVEPADQETTSLVAEVGERLGGEHRAHPGRAVDDDGRRLVGDPALDLELEPAAGHVDGAGDRPLLVLVGLADVEQDDLAEARLDVVGLDLPDDRPGLVDQLSGAGHD